MTDEPLALSRTKAAAVLVVGLCAWLSLSQPAAAGPLGSLFGRHPSDGRDIAAPPVARYVTEDGDVFTFDRTQSKALLKFDGSFEVWALQPQPAPRGDTIYKNDLGEPMLRATRLGGLTLFTIESPGGTAVALQGEAPPIRPPAILSPTALFQRLAQASAHASHVMQRLMEFDAPDVTPESAYLIADAAAVTAEAIAGLDRKTREGLKLTRVVFVAGHAPAAKFTDGVLQITVAPSRGVAGRPSSRRIDVVMNR